MGHVAHHKAEGVATLNAALEGHHRHEVEPEVVVALEAYRLALGMFEVALIEVEVVLSLLPYDLIQVEQVLALVVLSLLLYDEIQVEQVEAY